MSIQQYTSVIEEPLAVPAVAPGMCGATQGRGIVDPVRRVCVDAQGHDGSTLTRGGETLVADDLVDKPANTLWEQWRWTPNAAFEKFTPGPRGVMQPPLIPGGIKLPGYTAETDHMYVHGHPNLAKMEPNLNYIDNRRVHNSGMMLEDPAVSKAALMANGKVGMAPKVRDTGLPDLGGKKGDNLLPIVLVLVGLGALVLIK